MPAARFLHENEKSKAVCSVSQLIQPGGDFCLEFGVFSRVLRVSISRWSVSPSSVSFFYRFLTVLKANDFQSFFNWTSFSVIAEIHYGHIGISFMINEREMYVYSSHLLMRHSCQFIYEIWIIHKNYFFSLSLLNVINNKIIETSWDDNYESYDMPSTVSHSSSRRVIQ